MTRQDAVAAVILTASLATWAAICSAPARAADTVPFVVALNRPAAEVPMAFAQGAGAVIQCESRWRAGAVNPSSGATGLFQVHPIHRGRVGGDLSLLFDPEINVSVAHSLYVESGGWGPWRACSR